MRAAGIVSRCRRGQALLELLIGLPLVILLTSSLLLMLAGALLRLELLSLGQELRVCYESTHPSSFCRARFQKALEPLPGHWRWKDLRRHGEIHHLLLEHQLPLLRNPWSLEI